MIERRALLKGLAAVAALPVLTACSGRSGADSGTSEDDFAGALSYRLTPPRSIDPFDADVPGLAIAYQLFDQLMRYDFSTGELACWAAESVDASDDATQFTFRLRQGLVFSDGSAVDAQGFKRAWERLVDPAGASTSVYGESPWAYLLTLVDGYDALRTGTAGELAGVTCPDAATLQVVLSKPYADFPLLCAHPALSPVPSAAVEDAESFHAQPVGNGPFTLANAWDGKAAILMERAEGYASPGGTDAAAGSDNAADDGGEAVARVRFVLNVDASNAYKQLEAGDIDVADVPVEQLESAEKVFGPREEGLAFPDGCHLLSATSMIATYLVLNMAEPPFDRVEVRRALSLAIDREALCEKVFRGSCAPATSVVPPCIPVEGQRDWTYAAYDTERAKQLLEPLYPAGEDGSRDLEISLAYSKGGSNAKLADALAEDFKAVGVSVKTEVSDWDDFVLRYRTGDFSCGCMNWTPEVPSLDSVLYPLFRSGVAAAGNYARYSNPEVDAALDSARKTVESVARCTLQSQTMVKIAEDVPVIPLTFPLKTIATSPRVKALTLDPYGYPHLDEVTFT